MDIRQLKYFVSIAETCNFSASAQQFCMTQSAISQQIKALEAELHADLFDRTTHSVSLTDNGALLLPLARAAIEKFEDCRQRMVDIRTDLHGELNIGLTYSLESYVQPTLISFMKKYPHVSMRIFYLSIPELFGRLQSRDLDLAISLNNRTSNIEMDSTPLVSYRLCAVMRSGHPLASRAFVTFDDLRDQMLILPEQGIRDRDAVERFINADTGHLHVRALINNPCAIIDVLRDSDFVSILAEQSVRGDNSMTTIPIKGLSEPITCYAHTLSKSYHKRSAEAFVEMYKEISVPLAEMLY